ncbi:MAG: N-6 DNA methylase, partial [Bacillota bacterium]
IRPKPLIPTFIAIMNPPYIRQEWIDKKAYYQAQFQQKYQANVPGTSNLYVYFVVKVIQNLKPGGKFAIILYDSWQSTLYGRWLMSYLKDYCYELEIETVTDQPFGEQLIDATILYGIKRSIFGASPKNQSTSPVITKPQSPLKAVSGFEAVETLFSTRRGLRLKQVDFFLCELDE